MNLANFPCEDLTSQTVIDYFPNIFYLFGIPAYIQPNRSQLFLSREITTFINTEGVARSR